MSKENCGMTIDDKNCKIVKKGSKFIIKIILDTLGNYVHSESMPLNDALIIRLKMLNSRIELHEVKIVPDKTYFRINLNLKFKSIQKRIFFHGRMQNLVDVIHDYDKLTGED